MCAKLPLWQLTTQGQKISLRQLGIFIYLNSASGLIVLIQVHLLANTSNFLSGAEDGLIRKLAVLAKLNNNASLACPLRHWLGGASPTPH
jgi:hypothetical protein